MKTNKQSEQTVEVECAFCGGTGKDPFGLMSPLATCQVCSGSGRHLLMTPIAPCAFCKGAGVHPHTRMTCTGCGGIGKAHIQADSVACPACQGTGNQDSNALWPDSPFYCGYCHGIGLVSPVRATLWADNKQVKEQ